MHTGMHIGAIVDKNSLEPLTDAIVRIMSTPADQKTIRAALALIGRQVETRDLTIQHVSITGDTTHEHYGPEETATAAEGEAV